MTIERLQEQIAADGVAQALVFLHKDHVAASPDVAEPSLQLDAKGRVTRVAAITNPAIVSDLAKMSAASHEHPLMHFPFLGVLHGVVDADSLASLAAHKATKHILHTPELSIISPVAANANDVPPAGPTWGVSRMNAPALHAQGHTGKHIVVAHLDSGADSQHPALQSAIEKYAAFDKNGRQVDTPAPYSDTDEHGTHTAGTIAGRVISGAPLIGVAPDAELIDATVVGGGSSISRVLAGLDWSLGKGARVINLSLGFKGWDDSFVAIINTLRQQQLLPVVAIGNDGPNHSRSPGNYPNVLSVGAVDSDDKVVMYSSSPTPGGDAVGPALCAPGVNVLSSKPGGGYRESSGTSMAAPHIAGLAALLFSAKPDATIDQVEKAIVRSCRNSANVDAVRIGAGIPDAVRALEYLL